MMVDSDLKKHGYADGNYWNTCPTCGGTYQGDKRARRGKGCAMSADRIGELEADNADLRKLLSDIDAVTIWEAGGTVPDRSMQDRIDAALEVKGKD